MRTARRALIGATLVLAAAIAYAAQVRAQGLTGNPWTQDGNHIITGGAAPTISSGCGTGATIAGTDVAGNIQMGTTTSQPCTVTFTTSYGTKPVCTVTSETVLASSSVAPSGASLDITSLVDLARYRYHCIGRPRP